MVELLYKAEICREARISPTKYDRLRRKGLIPLRMFGDRPCMSREDLEKWLRNLPLADAKAKEMADA